MSLFSNSHTLVFIALALLLTAAALGLVLRPLLSHAHLRRSSAQATHAQASAALQVLQEQRAELERDYQSGRVSHAHWQQALQEIERRALAEGLAAPAELYLNTEKTWALGSALFIVLFSIGGYLALGEPAAVIPGNTVAASSANDSEALADMVESLAVRLSDSGGGTPQEWMMLARSYMVLGNHAKAGDAYARLLELEPENANALAGYAEALLLGEDGIDPRAAALLERALAVSPQHGTALLLSGSIAFQQQNYQLAVTHWEALLAGLPPDDPDLDSLHSAIADAKERLSKAN